VITLDVTVVFVMQYASVQPSTTGFAPPKAKAAVCVPDPACAILGVISPVPALQTNPLNASVHVVVDPPKANAFVCVPTALK
jgi:hypothetical protein